MLHRMFGALAMAGALLVSWVAVSQPRSSSSPANLLAPVFQPGIAPVPEGSAGHYVLQHRRASALFSDTGVALRLPSRTERARELGWSVTGGRAVTPRPEKPRAAKLHRLVGPRESWEREVPTYGGLRYPGVLPGVDLWFEERTEGLEYGFRAERGKDLRRVGLEYAGARALRVVEEGRALEVDLGEGVLREEGLRCVQESAEGLPRPVGCWFAQARPVGPERWAYSIEVAVEDPERPVVVDPLVRWNTYLGGTGDDVLQDIATTANGDILIVGTVGSQTGLSLPTGSTSSGVLTGSSVLVASFHADGGLLWATQLGGAARDEGRSLVLGAAGEVYVAGTTWSADFPKASAPGQLPDAGDGFVVKLAPSGGALEWAYRLGGSGHDEIHDLAPGPGGTLFVAGESTSTNLPQATRTNPDLAFQGKEGLVTSLDVSDGGVNLLWTRLVNGQGDQVARSVLVQDLLQGIVMVTGSAPNPSVPAHGVDAFVAGFFRNGNSYPALTSAPLYIGGPGTDEARVLLASKTPSQGELLVVGNTTADAGGTTVFITSLNSSFGVNPIVKDSVTLGGPAQATSARVGGPSQDIYVGGFTSSTSFPLDGGFDSSLGGTSDGFVAAVRMESTPAVQWLSFVGGSSAEDKVQALDVDEGGRLLIGGSTHSTDLKYADAGHDPTQAGGSDMFLLRVEPDAPSEVDGGVADGGQQPEEDGGLDGGGQEPPDGGDGGSGTQVEPASPLGWSCGTTGSSGGTGLALGTLAALMLLAARRKRATSGH
ncbi:hypothetical protein [Archangium sp.]|uniref:DUF7948 domain-containing protein n=1 Tax=Archangium sp. TaxID=1872627 RepID=UPI00286D0CB0|nr:hypothetical protein [Archangium sp.]